MTVKPMTADDAYKSIAGAPNIQNAPVNVPLVFSTPFVCPYCHVNSQHGWGSVTSLTVFVGASGQGGRQYSGSPLVAAHCQTCNKETIFLDGRVVVPAYSPAPQAVEDMPEEIALDYEEARQIVSQSPRGAAALLRLAIQKLCPILGSTKNDINSAIGELVSAGKITPLIQKALDTVRVIGNESVHPGTIDLRDDVPTAISLFNLINFIIQKAVTEPKQIGELYQALPAAKLAGIAQRDASKP